MIGTGACSPTTPTSAATSARPSPWPRSWRASRAWITGRKRFQGGLRRTLEAIELESGTERFKLNPLATWDADRIETYRVAHDLPAHPLLARGYRSIGCASCTRPTAPDAPARAGRWFGIDKTECGIHQPVPYGDNI